MASSILNSDDGVISGTSGLKNSGGDDGVLVFQSKGTETARITTDNYLRLASGGIQFNGDTAAANALDDYEEGTWTASVGGTATYNDQTCYYTKIGRVVYVSGILFINNIGTGSASTISGLPFTSSNGNTGGSAFYYSGISSSAYHNPIPALTGGAVTSFGFSWNTAGATTTSQFRANLFQNSSRIEFGFFYFAS
jgi:hypothetical protein